MDDEPKSLEIKFDGDFDELADKLYGADFGSSLVFMRDGVAYTSFMPEDEATVRAAIEKCGLTAVPCDE